MKELVPWSIVFHVRTVSAMVLCLVAGFCQQPATRAETEEMTARGGLVRLDVTPMRDPVSTFVSVEGTIAEKFHYSRPRLAVVQTGVGSIPGARRQRIARLLQASGFRAALRRRSFAGEGLSGGDQFHLAVAAQGECFGFISEAPAEVQNLIQELLQLSSTLGETQLVTAYVRSEPIDPQRAESLRRSLDFRPWDTVPSDLRPPVTRAIENPRFFISLRPPQLTHLLEWGRGRRQNYINSGRNYYELTLYTGKVGSALNRSSP